jgi:choline dehydrogenase-like flavoprotein
MTASDDIDVVVIGSGMGGATFAAGLAPSGARILILERGERLLDIPETRDISAPTRPGSTPPARRSIPAIIITSGATPSSMAPC